MRNILIVNDEMQVGGVARVLVNMLKEIEDLDCNIDILILHPWGDMLKDIPESYPVIPSTRFFELCDQSISEIRKKKDLVLLIRKAYFFILMKTGRIHRKIRKERKKIIHKQYDVEIAYKEGFCTIFVADGDSRKKVNWVHVDYKKNNYSANHMNLMRGILQNIDVEVAQSNDAAEAYKEVFELKDEFLIINNFVDGKMIREKASVPYSFKDDSFHIVSVGRLHHQKAFMRMMEVCRRLNEKGFTYDYYIVGEGEERNQLEEKIRNYHLTNVHLLGYDENPYKYIRNADLFLLASDYESAPTVVYEALSVGNIPIVATDVAGIHDQLGDNEYGIIAENSEDGLYQVLSEILDDPAVLNPYRKKTRVLKNNVISKEKIRKLFLED